MTFVKTFSIKFIRKSQKSCYSKIINWINWIKINHVTGLKS